MPNGGSVNHTDSSDFTTTSFGEFSGLPSNLSASTVTVPSYSVRVTRTEYDGKITVLVDKFDGKPLNSPNDIVVKSDDSVWFTDPPFGILGNYEGHVATPELPTNVYRVDKSGRVTVATGEVNRPNGPAGKPIGFIALPERCANVCFGGVKRNRLFMAASHSVYSLFTGTQGVKGG